MTQTTVVNIKSGVSFSEYIGRANRRYGLRASKWANPFAIKNGVTRQEAIERYRAYLLRRHDLMAALPELRGKVLACWCAPEACHGDVLAELADAARPATGDLGGEG